MPDRKLAADPAGRSVLRRLFRPHHFRAVSFPPRQVQDAHQSSATPASLATSKLWEENLSSEKGLGMNSGEQLNRQKPPSAAPSEVNKGIADEEEARRIRPVSYTHLDVYKRQWEVFLSVFYCLTGSTGQGVFWIECAELRSAP